MEIAIWIIAICSLIRIIQNGVQLMVLVTERSGKYMKKATGEFVKSLHMTNKEFVADILREIEEENNG